MVLLRDNENCYVCGAKNQDGLRASFEIDAKDRSIRGTFTPRPEHEGWTGIVHGGLITTLLDEAMVKLAANLGMPAVSAELTVKFRSPARPGEELVVRGRIVDSQNRLILAEACVGRGAVIVAEAKGKLLKIRPDSTLQRGALFAGDPDS
jgi:uncharacterized protein (TIGR00369 family)